MGGGGTWRSARGWYGLVYSRRYGLGSTVALAVSCWLPTAAARVRAQVRSREICGGQCDNGAGVL
jgi:hypothetical protein